MKQDNPFAKLGALDQKLYTETTSPVRPDTKSTISGNPESQNSGKQEIQKARTLEIQKAREPEIQNSGNPESQKPAKREFYTKGTYRLCDEALDALGSAKAILRRKYKLRVNLEEIVETAVLQAYRDLDENKEKSSLVVTYSRIPENQNS
jgi:hypothetical protein